MVVRRLQSGQAADSNRLVEAQWTNESAAMGVRQCAHARNEVAIAGSVIRVAATGR
jgi:hypothetical protein